MRRAFSRPSRRSRRPPAHALADEYRVPVDLRRAAAVRLVGDSHHAVARIAAAPPGYLLVHGSSDIARQCELLTPLPRAQDVRVDVTPGRSAGEWHIDVATRDRPGLLAAFTGVLAAARVDVVQAVLATWDDGAALEAFVVRSAGAPDASALQMAFLTSLHQPLDCEPVADATLTFDNGAAALYTRCDVQAPDRPGLLHALAVAITTAGADVHAARVTTVEGSAHDVFDLSDPAGRKLDHTIADVIRDHLRDGAAAVS